MAKTLVFSMMMMLLSLSNLPHHYERGGRNCVDKISAWEGFKNTSACDFKIVRYHW